MQTDIALFILSSDNTLYWFDPGEKCKLKHHKMEQLSKECNNHPFLSYLVWHPWDASSSVHTHIHIGRQIFYLKKKVSLACPLHDDIRIKNRQNKNLQEEQFYFCPICLRASAPLWTFIGSSVSATETSVGLSCATATHF